MAYNHPKGLCYVSDNIFEVMDESYSECKSTYDCPDNPKMCFIPIPKNASTTWRQLVSKYSRIPLEEHNFIKNPEILEQYYTVCIIRNPIERLCTGFLEIIHRSEFSFKGLSDETISILKNFMYINKVLNDEGPSGRSLKYCEEDRFLKFIEILKHKFFDAHIESQSFYISDENGKTKFPKINKIFLLDEFSNFLIEKEIKVHHNSSKDYHRHGQPKSWYLKFFENKDNKEILNIVKEIYKDDLKLYNKLKNGQTVK